MAMRHPLAKNDQRFSRDGIAVDFVGAEALPELAPAGRIDAQRFLEDGREQWKVRDILRVGAAPLQMALDFVVRLLLNFRMQAQEIPRPCQGGPDVFVAA